jgi:dipeptidyl aminopeptidase/acylaminoacyl peptidase
MSPVQSFWFTGAHGDKVEGFLVMPPNSGPQWLSSEPHSEVSEASGTAISKKYPVKFLIHGGPQGAWGDDWSYRWNSELFAANGYVVVMINFHGSTGYGQKFIDAINRDWGGAPFEDLMKGLDYAEQHYPFIDKDRECALGASYGGWMANWILGHTNRFKCIVSHDGMFDSVSAWGSTEESRGLPQVVAASVVVEFQDAHLGHSRPTGLSPRCFRRISFIHDLAAPRRGLEDALFPRRRPLGAQAAEFPALVQDGKRLGGPVDWEKK